MQTRLALFRLSGTRPLHSESGEVDPIVRKWWEMMAPLMNTNSDLPPVLEPVEEMFRFAEGDA